MPALTGLTAQLVSLIRIHVCSHSGIPDLHVL